LKKILFFLSTFLSSVIWDDYVGPSGIVWVKPAFSIANINMLYFLVSFHTRRSSSEDFSLTLDICTVVERVPLAFDVFAFWVKVQQARLPFTGVSHENVSVGRCIYLLYSFEKTFVVGVWAFD
jgi:hypothetical protein